MRVFVSDAERRLADLQVDEGRLGDEEMQLVRVHPQHIRQAVVGFGGAVTEAVALTFAQMDGAAQERFLRLCFTSEGADYSLVRIPIQSCDFSEAPYDYLSDRRDTEFATFSISHDRQAIIPLLKRIQQIKPEVEFLASPWSPPAFMKSNRIRNAGGSLLQKHYENWAIVVALYLLAYRDEGIRIRRVTVQNEPHASQDWESCRFSAQEERNFAVGYLRRALDAAGFADVGILGWDHNKERLLDRADALFADEAGRNAIDGLAFHIYSGDHFDAVREVRRCYPDAELLLSEGCMEYSDFDPEREVLHAEKYAHEWVGDMAAGANGCLDWNLLLNEEGGPTYIRNFCDAPLMFDRRDGRLRESLAFAYLVQVSRLLRPGARVCACSSYTADIETLAAVNPDRSCVCVMLNRVDREYPVVLTEGNRSWCMDLGPHAIATAQWGPQG